MNHHNTTNGLHAGSFVVCLPRCNRCDRPMKGSTAYDGACACGGLITSGSYPMGEVMSVLGRRTVVVKWPSGLWWKYDERELRRV